MKYMKKSVILLLVFVSVYYIHQKYFYFGTFDIELVYKLHYPYNYGDFRPTSLIVEKGDILRFVETSNLADPSCMVRTNNTYHHRELDDEEKKLCAWLASKVDLNQHDYLFTFSKIKDNKCFYSASLTRDDIIPQDPRIAFDLYFIDGSVDTLLIYKMLCPKRKYKIYG